MKEKSQKLKAGSYGGGQEPIIDITGTGRYAYIWIGNNSKDNKMCYATLSGRKTLEKLAKEILKAIK